MIEPNPNQVLPAGQWHGENLSTSEVANLRLAENRYPSGYRTSRHAHESFLFNLVLEGSLTQEFDRKFRDCRPMTLVALAPNEIHADIFHRRDARVFILEISQAWTRRILAQAQLPDRSLFFEGGLMPWLMLRMFREFAHPDKSSSLSIEGLTLEMFAEGWRSVTYSVRKPPAWLTRAGELLHDRFREALTVKEIACAVNIHPVHLARSFHRYYGCTMGEYVRRRRIEFASIQLMTSSAKVSEIALEAGFCDQSHFSNVFKRIIGVPPNVFRAACTKR